VTPRDEFHISRRKRVQKMANIEKFTKNELKPTVRVGKDGLTENVVTELKNQIKINRVVKVKVLPSSVEKKREIAEELAERSVTKLIEVRGSTILFCNPRHYKGD
jgi:RNA-binding protein